MGLAGLWVSLGLSCSVVVGKKIALAFLSSKALSLCAPLPVFPVSLVRSVCAKPLA